MHSDKRLEALLRRVAAQLEKKPKGKTLAKFARRFLGQAIVEELEQYEPAELAAIVSDAWAFMQSRVSGRPKIRIFNPKAAEQGWERHHTIIEIVNDDMPFLVDSVLGVLNQARIGIELVLHPILTVTRKADGNLKALADEDLIGTGEAHKESFIHIHTAFLASEDQRRELAEELEAVLTDVRTVVLDWQPMRTRLREALMAFQNNPPPVPVDELSEAIQFLQWLLDDHFTFLGMREYAFAKGPGKGELEVVRGSGLGLLRDPDVKVLRRGAELVSITPEVREFLTNPAPLFVSKANVRSTVHRRVHMEYVGVKLFDEGGAVTGELRVVGLFTSAAYTRSPRFIPLLRRKIAWVLQQSGFPPDSHSGKALLNILETYPRDELFQIDPELLSEFAHAILQLEERPRTRLFVRKDKFDRFVSAIVYLPRDQFNTAVRLRIGELLAEAYDGRVSTFYPSFPEGTLVRVHYIIGRYGGITPSPDVQALEAEIATIAKTWDDRLAEALAEAGDEEQASELARKYAGAFSGAYQEAFAPAEALVDIAHMERLTAPGDLAIDFYRSVGDPDTRLRLKLYHQGEPIALSDRLPILESMGFRAIAERSYRVTPEIAGERAAVWLHDIILETADGHEFALPPLKDLLEDCYVAVWSGRAENDGYNAMVLRKALPWRDVSILRALGKYLRQAGIPYSTDYMQAALNRHPDLAEQLVRLFHARLDPARATPPSKAAASQKRILAAIEEALQAVPSLDEDRIVRRFANLISAIDRTNFFQTDADGRPRPAIAFKIRSAAVEELPEPRPFAEIFVYAPDVEGVHLRGGKIARGGIRWSDRAEDFRTEVLGLVKAQNVKNAVIVPVGAKGGFVTKRTAQMSGRERILEEGVRCYRTFISSLLDVTDNLTEDGLVPPPDTVRHDGDDPYLVVAADKGTATFSDIANEISESRDFWLGDAFASGGSAGYDHKKMGITARGAWEAVKRHFREMDIDVQTTPFTVIGIGDMSGDVFGNGMLQSRAIRLIGAFDHRDIFIDPDPDPEASYRERERLFNLPRSSWQDYSRELISRGGGVFSRSAKSIPLSDEIRKLTGLKARQATPNELIRALMSAPADLLWFGGIGTYVRASGETDVQVGDRSNDALRVTAADLRVKVIGEGANLGMTQLARIEFAQRGGRINTDAIDNSAGVNSSDVEVNIKIALRPAERTGKLSRKARNTLLAQMTEEVAALVLRNNYLQTLSLSLAERAAADEFTFHARLMNHLESLGLLDRELEFLPSEVEMRERAEARKPLTRPELAVLMAHAKLTLYNQLLDSRVPDDSYLGRELMRYFPERMRRKFAAEIEAHRLRREIIATMLSNSMINRGGPAFVDRVEDETGAGVGDIAAAFALARDSFGFTDLNRQVDELDAEVAGDAQMELYRHLQTLLRNATIWFLRNVSKLDGLEQHVRHYRSGIEALSGDLDAVLPDVAARRLRDEENRLVGRGIPAPLAGQMARLNNLAHAPDIIVVASRCKRSIKDVARVFFGIGVELQIDDIVARSGAIDLCDYYERVAVSRLLDSISASQRSLTIDILECPGDDARALETWRGRNGEALARARNGIAELMDGDELTLARLAVISGHLRDLTVTR